MGSMLKSLEKMQQIAYPRPQEIRRGASRVTERAFEDGLTPEYNSIVKPT